MGTGMFRDRGTAGRVATALILGLALLVFAPWVVAGGSTGPFRFGITSVFVVDQPELLKAWRGYLEEKIGRPVEFVRRQTYAEITDMLLDGRLDAAWICTYPYVAHADRLDLLVVPTYGGRPLYRSYIIARAGEPHIRSVEDVRDKVFAYVEPRSNSGYLYPRYRLARAGLDPDTFFRDTFFTWSHPDVVEAVAEGLADGGAGDGYVWESLRLARPGLVARTRVVERSPWFGFPPVVTNGRQPHALRRALERSFLEMGRDPQGRRLLQLLNLDGFTRPSEGLYDTVREMAEAMRRAP